MIVALLLSLTIQQAAPVWVPPGQHPYTVSSASMQPGLTDGDVVIADRPRDDCGATTPTPGDVVVVTRDGPPWIRRIVAGPGQTVQMRGGALYIDGQAVKRERVDLPTPPYVLPVTVWRETLPSGRSWLTYDLVEDGDLDETSEIRVPAGHWFGLGDNRDNAIDDRVNGPTDEARLCGVLVKVARSSDPARVGVRP